MTRFLLALALLAAAHPGAAAELSIRPSVRVEGPMVLLGDVLEGAGDAAAQPVVRSPAPGESLNLPYAEVARAARQAGLSGIPEPTGYIRVARASRTVPEAAILSLLEQAISDREDGAGHRVRITGQRGALQVPTDADPLDIRLESLRFDERGGRLSASILLPGDGGMPVAVEIMAVAERLAEIPVLLRDFAPGEPIRARDIGTARIAERRLNRGTVTDEAMLIGREATRSLRAGEALRAGDVRAPVLVARGSVVTVTIVMAGMSLSATAKAMQEGTEGDVVRLLNLSTNRALEGRVIGPDLVEAIAPFNISSLR